MFKHISRPPRVTWSKQKLRLCEYKINAPKLRAKKKLWSQKYDRVANFCLGIHQRILPNSYFGCTFLKISLPDSAAKTSQSIKKKCTTLQQGTLWEMQPIVILAGCNAYQNIKEFTVTYQFACKHTQTYQRTTNILKNILTCMHTKTKHAKDTTEYPSTSQYAFPYP